MSRDETAKSVATVLQKAVATVLREVQELSGREVCVVDGSTKPIGDLDGFDSLCGVEAGGMLGAKLGVDLSGKNPFVTNDGTRARTVDEVAAAIRDLAGGSRS